VFAGLPRKRGACGAFRGVRTPPVASSGTGVPEWSGAPVPPAGVANRVLPPGNQMGGPMTPVAQQPLPSARSIDPDDLRELLAAMTAVRDGTFRGKLPESRDGILGEIAVVFNEMVERKLHLTRELQRVRRAVGREGKLSERLRPGPGSGVWA